jgi:sulfate transport system substrate-binding protein
MRFLQSKLYGWSQGFQSVKQAIKGWGTLFLIGISLAVAIAACSGSTSSSSSVNPSSQPVAQKTEAVELQLVSFAVTKAAHDAIIPKFVEYWKNEHHQTVSFKQASYGGSGTQAQRVIEGGLEADVVHLALGLDIDKIVSAGLIDPGWQDRTPNNGTASKSVVALATRSGNPKGIKGFADLAKDGVTVLTANPKTSGVARWNFLALWNSVIQSGGDEAKAQEFVSRVYRNVPELPQDARVARDKFYKNGIGDALLNYENEIILAQQQGQQVTYIIPDVNISIDQPVAVVDKYVDKHGTRKVAEGFVKFLFTPEAQTEFAKVGFRSVDEAIANEKQFTAKYPEIKKLSSVKDFGGWAEVQKKFFVDGAIFDQIQTRISQKN